MGAALAASDREGGRRRRMPVHDGAMGDREGGEGATDMGGGGGRVEAAGTPSLVGLRRRWMTMVRMKVAAGGTKQQPTPLWRRWRRWRMMTALVDDDDDDETAR